MEKILGKSADAGVIEFGACASIYSGFQLDEVDARNPVTLAKPGFSVPHLG
jgi:hypothetical protein